MNGRDKAMNKFLAAGLFILGTGLAVLADNPRNFPEYKQTLEIKFKSAEDARLANVKTQEFPSGKKLAFSTRWDDTNTRHRKMAQTLASNNLKGTFYLGYIDSSWFDQTAGDDILKSGSSIGAHTVHHPMLGQQNPNQVFYECMAIRPVLENRYNTCVSAFVLPFCNMTTPYPDVIPHMIGDLLARSGYLGGPEFWNNPATRYGLPANAWFGGALFSCNDANPNPEIFERELATKLKDAKKAEFGNHVTFGLHTWQKDEGFKILDKLYAKHGKNPDWWYCNENEFNAYRYQFHHTQIRKKKTNGKNVTFEITRIAAPELGHNIGITLAADRPVGKVLLNGKEIAVRENRFELPHNPARMVPTEIEAVRLGDMELTPCKKDANLSIGVKYAESENKLSVLLYSKTAVRDAVLIVRVPPVWKNGIFRQKLGELVPNTKRVANILLGEKSGYPGIEEGNLNFYIQLDYTASNGTIRRVHGILDVPRKFTPGDSPRDNAMLLGPVPAGKLTPEYLEKMSKATESPAPLGTNALEQWIRSRSAPGLQAITIAPGNDRARQQEVRKRKKGKDDRMLAMLQFIASDAQKCTLYVPARSLDALYLNGKKIDGVKKNRLEFTPVSGLNRVLVVSKGSEVIQMSVSRLNDPHKPLTFLKIEAGKTK